MPIRMTASELEEKGEELRAEKTSERKLPSNYPRPYFLWEAKVVLECIRKELVEYIHELVESLLSA